MKKQVELLAVMPDGNFVRMQILKAEVTDDLVRIYVTYEAKGEEFMSLASDVSEVLTQKDEAILLVIEHIKKGRSENCDVDCEVKSNYHWRGCPVKVDALLKELYAAMKLR